MTLQTPAEFIEALKSWEDDYQAGHKKLTLLELQELKTMLSQLLTQVDRDLTGPYSSSVIAPPDDAGAN
ncbi:MAG TPA: hypothetical protein VFU22_07600 [Roseiflexaceae bacterium]|nr:hypothetical protein [Roseiflexaceae bacterium]